MKHYYRNIFSRWLNNPGGKRAYLGKYRPPRVDWFKHKEPNLLELGYYSYDYYIKSALWQSIRQHIIDKYKGKCYLCDSDGVIVHHKQYDKRTLSGKKLDHLKLLCALCHKIVHTTDEGMKAEWHDVHFKFWVMERERSLVLKYIKQGTMAKTNPTYKIRNSL